MPLSDRALELLDSLPRFEGSDFVFPGAKDKPLSDMTLTAALRRMKVDATAHGFRSTFRDWCAERTSTPSEVAEMALAHAVGDATEAAYRRGDLFEKRRELMQMWAKFIDTAPLKGKVRTLRVSRQRHEAHRPRRGGAGGRLDRRAQGPAAPAWRRGGKRQLSQRLAAPSPCRWKKYDGP